MRFWYLLGFQIFCVGKRNVIRMRSGSSPDFFKNKIGTKSCNSRHFWWVIVAQKEDRLSILQRIEFLIGKNYETFIPIGFFLGFLCN